MNLPIVSATADVGLFIMGTNILQGWHTPTFETEGAVKKELELRKLAIYLMFKDPEVGDFPVLLPCQEIKFFNLPGTNAGCLLVLRFVSNSLGTERMTGKQLKKKWENISAGTFDDLQEAHIPLTGLSGKARIWGHCDLTLNSTIRRVFAIDPAPTEGAVVLRPVKKAP